MVPLRLQTYPAFLAACGLALGIFAALPLRGMDHADFLGATSLACMCIILGLCIWKHSRWTGVVALLLCVVLGMAKYLAETRGGLPEIPKAKVLLLGTIAEPPLRLGTRTRCLLRSVTYMEEGKRREVEGLVLTTIKSRARERSAPSLSYGTRIAITGSLALPPPRRNPGEFNLRQYYEANGISLLCNVPDDRTLALVDTTGGAWILRKVVFPVRQYILATVDTLIGGEEGAFLKGLLLGERSGLSQPLRQAFAISGVAHVLAVSGSNVAVVGLALLVFFEVIRIPRKIRPVLVALGLLVYMIITGNQPPVVRATIMGLVFLAARVRQRPTNPYNVLGISALIILLVDTRQLFDVGFQLSFVAVLALVHLYPALRLLYAAFRPSNIWKKLLVGACDLIALTMAATLGTLPITAAVFGRVSVIGLLANVLVVPATGLAVFLGMVLVVAHLAGHMAGLIYGAVTREVLHWTLESVRVSALAPFAAVQTLRFSAADALPYFAVLLFVFHLRTPRVTRGLVFVVMASFCLRVFLPPDRVFAGNETTLRCIVMDVGQGDAILLQFPGGKTLLIDAGPAAPGNDMGEKIIVPFLTRLGVQRLDAVLISHPHDDHFGGLRAIASVFPIDRLIVDVKRFNALSQMRGVASQVRTEGSVGERFVFGGGRIYVLSSRDTTMADTFGPPDLNAESLVVKVVYGKTALLFPGDAPSTVEQHMIRRYGNFLESDFLKVGHHGSATSSSDEWLDVVRPELAAISAGQFNRHGHPAPSTLKRFAERPILVGRTDEDGALIFESDGTTITPLQWQ
jgi:competence protein ComEC